MPELPEVHALVADLGARLAGRAIRRLDVLAISALKTYDPPVTALGGATVTRVRRFGKFICIDTDGPSLVIHLARSGWLRWRAGAPGTQKRGRGPLAARLVLDDGSGFDVTEQATIKKLQLHVVTSPLDVPGIASLGPDPLAPDFTLEVFARIVRAAGKAQLKGVLRDQRRIAGIGNAYSDEILHAARMSPFKPADLTDAEASVLYDAMGSTLREAIARSEGLSASELKGEKKSGLRVHGRAGEPCPVCGTTIRQVIYHDSSLQYCPGCQTGGKVLADRVLSRLLK